MPAHKVVIDKQMDMLLEYMEADHSFAIGGTPLVPALKQETRQKWEQLAAQLNAVGGANKSASKWRDYWTERKYGARKKAQQKMRQQTGKDPPKKITFSTTELRILSLISNWDVKQNLSEVTPFEHFDVQESSEDMPSSPISPSSPPPVYVLDPSAGPSDPQFVKASVRIKTPDSPEHKSSVFAVSEETQAPQAMQELEDRLIVTENRKVAAIERQTAAIERQTAAIERQTATIEQKTATIERKAAAFTENIDSAANRIVASIDRLASALADNRQKRVHITPVKVRSER